ncbi:MAG: D-glycerate dehydrogenase, partial [Rhodocyclaceae bacterium]|nr:D-glycerate dehydrogenase [Rhodocyclaceae bacterium]
MKPKILISRQVFPQIVDELSQYFEVDHNASDDILSAEQLRARAAGCAALMCCLTEKIDAAFFDACPTVKVVSNIAVGYN